jgi:nitrate reductase cytochrome c-type subunit
MRYLRSGLLLTVFLFCSFSAYTPGTNEPAQQDTVRYISPFAKENERCFKCHSLKKYQYTDETSGKIMKGIMDPDGILSMDSFYSANHKSFSCTDCHSSQFREFPHSEELKNEPQFNCLDCHGGDPSYAVFNFEEIDAEFRRSVHFRLEDKGFTCWECHDPHSYKLTARHSEDLKETVLYDNSICLDCHADYSRFRQYSDREKINLKKVHKWLPHRSIHFSSIRCLDCHTKANEKILVPHYVMPEEAALRDCKKCHTGDAEAMTSLLMTKADGKNNKDFNNDAVVNGLSLIGPNRNKLLDNILLVFFTAVMAVIGIHIIFRVIIK